MDAHRGIEPDALNSLVADADIGAGGKTLDSTSLRSIAISLRRIADATVTALGDEARNEYGETPFQAIGAGISRALREHGR